jgi:hypothetical protein
MASKNETTRRDAQPVAAVVTRTNPEFTTLWQEMRAKERVFAEV